MSRLSGKDVGDDCNECGDGITEEDLEMCLLGLGLFYEGEEQWEDPKRAVSQEPNYCQGIQVEGWRHVHKDSQALDRRSEKGGKIPTLEEKPRWY